MADPDGKAITVSYSGLAMVWCIARYAVLMLEIVKANRGAVGGRVDIAKGDAELRGLLEYAETLRQADLPWPSGLTPPDIAAGDQAEINNVFFGAVDWILLHEVGHVHLGHTRWPVNRRSDSSPPERRRHSC